MGYRARLMVAVFAIAAALCLRAHATEQHRFVVVGTSRDGETITGVWAREVTLPAEGHHDHDALRASRKLYPDTSWSWDIDESELAKCAVIWAAQWDVLNAKGGHYTVTTGGSALFGRDVSRGIEGAKRAIKDSVGARIWDWQKPRLLRSFVTTNCATPVA